MNFIHHREQTLLGLACVFVLTAVAALALAPFARANSWNVDGQAGAGLGMAAVIAVWLLGALSASRIVGRALPDHDPYLLPLAYLLSGWGITLIWRLFPNFGLRQTLWLAVGTGAMLIVVALPGDLRWLRRYRYTWLVAGLGLTALTFIAGVNPSGEGQRLWLGGLGLYLQPAEILKLLLVVFLAAYLSERREALFTSVPRLPGALAPHLRFPNFPYFLPLVVMWSFSMLILIAQRDLGTSTLFFAAFLIMLYLASGAGEYVIAGVILLLLGAVAGYSLFDVVRVRVEAWWNPWADPTGRSYQIVQSLIALASGGLFGRGPGLGNAGLIPVAHSDFILAALAEEWGLLGLIGALALISLVVLRGLRIALRARGAFDQLLAAGLASLIGVQSLLITGGVLKVIPLTGVTLPFLSYGGSSMLVHFVMVGLLLKLSAGAGQR
jgi:cell division protein FtsW (lipid II flippase)